MSGQPAVCPCPALPFGPFGSLAWPVLTADTGCFAMPNGPCCNMLPVRRLPLRRLTVKKHCKYGNRVRGCGGLKTKGPGGLPLWHCRPAGVHLSGFQPCAFRSNSLPSRETSTLPRLSFVMWPMSFTSSMASIFSWSPIGTVNSSS